MLLFFKVRSPRVVGQAAFDWRQQPCRRSSKDPVSVSQLPHVPATGASLVPFQQSARAVDGVHVHAWQLFCLHPPGHGVGDAIMATRSMALQFCSTGCPEGTAAAPEPLTPDAPAKNFTGFVLAAVCGAAPWIQPLVACALWPGSSMGCLLIVLQTLRLVLAAAASCANAL
jgi:hypothetical protein